MLDTSPDNLSLLEDVYKRFLADPASLDQSWQRVFQTLESVDAQPKHPSPPLEKTEQLSSDLKVFNLIEAYRTYGHLYADINPITTQSIQEPWQLNLETLGFSKEDLTKQTPTCGLLPTPIASLAEIIKTLKSYYCNKIGIEYMEIKDANIKGWLRNKIESNQNTVEKGIEQKKMILHQLNRSELFESFLQTKFTGQKRFSLEGAETLIPMLEAIVETGSQMGLEQFLIGMAHRGRLNVLSNILNKSHADIFSEFEEGYIQNAFEGSSDVKYHKGFSSEVTTPAGKTVQISLAPNPSHLESVYPVVEGQVKARQIKIGDGKGDNCVIPILIHGDAAVTGQGVVYETMELSGLAGYSTGGTIHIVINNQIGFTAIPEESRSTRYCTDIARAFDVPVFHVNAEDPEEAVHVTNIAVELRQKFHCDVFIDLVCYRKYGHNESDEPAYTQPLEYQIIRKKKPIRELYRDQLVHQGITEQHIVESLEKEFTQGLQQSLQESKDSFNKPKIPTLEGSKKTNHSPKQINTAVSKEILKEVAEKISTVPPGFDIHPKLHALVQERLTMVLGGEKSKPFDWGMGELLAYGTLLWEGIDVRLSGQDSRRGTFSHRHAIWMDQVKEQAYCPLKNLKSDQGRFDVINSPLSEFAVLGFEFGYSCAFPEALVLWEAQFGDFCNGAQIMIDQYISTAEQKWGQKFGLTLLLPHGYEGQGPEHSSGRMERFLLLCGEDNMRVVNPTTPAQFFHLLRRQALSTQNKPLIVFTPKGLLRHPACVSNVEDFTKGRFQEILDDPQQESVESNKGIKKVAFCCGRIYYDLIAEREKRKVTNLAIIRIEQLYPFQKHDLQQLLEQYSSATEYFWVQEEPSNMGAWGFIQPQINEILPTTASLKYIGRKRSASPAVGSHALHKKQHAEILSAVFGEKI